MSEAKPVAGYYRVSLARDNMVAPQLYEEEINRYCTYRNLELAQIYSDIDLSAFRGAKARPSLEELVKKRTDYSAIIVPKLSRFGRSMQELIRLFTLFDNDGIPLVFLDMNLDTSTSQGRLLRHILAAFAEYESDVKADYARANHRRIRMEGRPFGTPPVGYVRTAPSTWVIDEERAPVVRAIYERFAGGMAARAVAIALNDLGIPSPRATVWTSATVGKVLDNPAYAALSLFDGELVPAVWPPIVSRELWDKARERRRDEPRRKGNIGVKRPRGGYLLSGLIWCGQCGGRMTHSTSHRKTSGYGVYQCSGQWDSWTHCLGSRVYDYLADAYVTDAFLERCAFTILSETGARSGSPRRVWDEASLPEKQRLLRAVIERIVIKPLGIELSFKERRTTLRHDIRIEWSSEVADSQDVAVLAEPDQLMARHPRRRAGRAGEMRAHDVAETIERHGGQAESSLSAHAPPTRASFGQRPGVGEKRPLPSAEGLTWAEWTRLIRSRS